jgi:hypothetical protein
VQFVFGNFLKKQQFPDSGILKKQQFPDSGNVNKITTQKKLSQKMSQKRSISTAFSTIVDDEKKIIKETTVSCLGKFKKPKNNEKDTFDFFPILKQYLLSDLVFIIAEYMTITHKRSFEFSDKKVSSRTSLQQEMTKFDLCVDWNKIETLSSLETLPLLRLILINDQVQSKNEKDQQKCKKINSLSSIYSVEISSITLCDSLSWLLQQLPSSVFELHIVYLDFNIKEKHKTFESSLLFENIKTLYIDYIVISGPDSMASYHNFFKFLLCFPNLTVLNIDGMYFEHCMFLNVEEFWSYFLSHDIYFNFPRLESLSIDLMHEIDYTKLKIPNQFKSLQHLTFLYDNDETLSNQQRFNLLCKEGGASLKSISFVDKYNPTLFETFFIAQK